MAVVPVRLFGDPVLTTPCSPVQAGEDITGLAADLLDTMDHNGGAGLAAPQIGISKRVFAYGCGGERGIIANPEWVAVGTTPDDDARDAETEPPTETDDEGCLSIPGIHQPTTRFAQVIVRGTNEHGQPVALQATGILARCIQHETDHLDGVLFLKRLEPEYRKAAMKAIRESAWFGHPAISDGELVDLSGRPLS